ncbi:serine hydrolase, partial [Bacteroides sp. OttesenSCG-928-F21]|nr:serine hydrolase [Bacteroides sp. OttesenSCG-928-F21]
AMQGVGGNKHLSLQAIKAGHDMVLTPRSLKAEINAVMEAIEREEFSVEEIEAKCKKVLTYKYILGLSDEQKVVLSGLEQRINTPQARDLIQRLKLAAITVATNKQNMLPIHTDVEKVALVNIGTPASCNVFTETLKKYVSLKQITLRPDLTEGERRVLRNSLASYKRIVVAVTEKNLASYRKFLSELAPETPVTYVFFTNEKAMVQLQQELRHAPAIVLAHSNDKFVQGQVGNMLFGKAVANGRLSVSIGNLFKAGTGVTVSPFTPRHFNPEEYGLHAETLNRIDSIAIEGITKGAYPGCQVLVLKNGQTMYEKCFGTHTGGASQAVTPNSIYDIASLTKTSATLLAVMKLYDKGLFNLSDKVSAYLPELQDTDKENITIRELLYHESGLPSTLSFYLRSIDKESYEGRLFSNRRTPRHRVRIGANSFAQANFKFLDGFISPQRTEMHTRQVSDKMWLNRSFNDSITAAIIETPMRSKTYRYSCVGFILLQRVVEQLSGMSLDDYLRKEFYEPMGLKRTAYNPLRYFSKEEIVPSSTDNFLRKTVVQGFVHDEAAAFQGGVSGNAGLFSTAQEVARIYQMLLNGGELDGKRYLSKETCHLFTTAKAKNSRRGLGFDKPDMSDKRKSPCGELAPASVYGHTGFTGTSAWVDPTNNIVIVFISNRIYPNVWVNELSALNIRSRIQDVVYEALKTN